MSWRPAQRLTSAILAGVLCLGGAAEALTPQESASGHLAGAILDESSGALAGASVTVTAAVTGIVVARLTADERGEFRAALPPGTYRLAVAFPGFAEMVRDGVVIEAGVQVRLTPPVVLRPAGRVEIIDIDDRDNVPLLQTQSGERSAAISLATLEALPISTHTFQQFLGLVPGVHGVTRAGGGGQDLYTLDGVSVMDTGNNGLMGGFNLPVDAVEEVTVATSGYQAEFGRSSGLQIAATTKSGTNAFRFSMFQYNRDSGTNANAWANTRNGYPRSVSQQIDVGATFGGPIGRPGGSNRLFFFYSHELRPRRSGNFISNMRVPTAAERRGDFSDFRDQNGQPFHWLYDLSSGLPKDACSATDQRACFRENGVLGRIPVGQLYGPGLALLNQYPLPNVEQVAGRGYNYETVTPIQFSLAHTPLIRVDAIPRAGLRISAKWVGSTAIVQRTINRLPGFDDTLQKFPLASSTSASLSYVLSPAAIVEGTYGTTANRLGTPPVSAFADRRQILCPDDLAQLVGACRADDLDRAFADADVIDPATYAFRALREIGAPFFADGRALLPPQLAWAAAGTTSRLSTFGCVPGSCAPPSLNFPPFFNSLRTHDVSANLTFVSGNHTIKTGVFVQHSAKAQNLASGVSFQGVVNFGNDSTNPLDTGVPFANAATGIFSLFAQQASFVEGQFVYNNVEWFVQDRWRAMPKLTIDYGVRFVRQTPQYDQRHPPTNFLPERWSQSAAPALYEPACVAASPCAALDRRARDPRSDLLLGPGSASLIGQTVPRSGDLANGIVLAGDGIPRTAYDWPALGLAPRVGFAFDATGKKRVVFRGAAGLYFDRPDGGTVFGTAGNPPTSTGLTQQWGRLADLTRGGMPGPVPTLRVYFHDSKLPSDIQWNGGVQLALGSHGAVDLSYVGHHGFHLLGGQQGQGAVDLNAIDLGTALGTAGQDPTQAAGTPLNNNLLRPYRGYSNILVQWGRFERTFHSLQMSFTRRLHHGLSAGLNWTYTLRDRGTTNLPSPQLRLDHRSDGTIGVRADQPIAERLFGDQGTVTHVAVAHFVWQVPVIKGNSRWRRGMAWLFDQSQVSGIFRFDSGAPYEVGYSYQTGGGVRLTGSPDYIARIVIGGDPGSGCSNDQYRQFNTAAFRGPVQGSDGLESPRFPLHGCGDRRLDLAIQKAINIGGKRQLILRGDVMNVFDRVVYSARNVVVQFDNPADQRVLNAQFLPDGRIDPGRSSPQTAGFGAATAALSPRLFQGQIRIKF